MIIIENVLLIAVLHNKLKEEQFYYSLDELKALVRTAEGKVIDRVVQRRHSPHRSYYMGDGKIKEIQQIIEEQDIELIIANEELTGGQLRNLQDKWEVRVIDRSQLILDIFAMRAHTNEAKLQVELAQYTYMLPRLHGQGEALSRLGGGIGTRGPGETKLETDRRHITRRMVDIKRRLKDAVNQREQYRKNRRKNKLFQVAIVGYTNAGKSTLFNQLTKEDTLYEDKLFATLDPLSRRVKLPSNLEILLTDTVGFIQDLPTALIAAFRSTLEEVTEADIILHVIDVNAPNRIDQEKTVAALLTDLEANNIPRLILYNKRDLINEYQFIPEAHPSLLISTKDKTDIQKVKQQIESLIRELWHYYEVIIPEGRTKALTKIRQHTILEQEEYDENKQSYIVKGYVDLNHPIMKEIKEFQQE